MATALNAQDIRDALASLPGWEHRDGALRKTYRFSSFREAMSFLVRVAFEAEAANHHPEIRNVYSTVDLALNTHDAGGAVTHRDVDVALAIERFNWLG